MTLLESVGDSKRVFIDTSPIIYAVEPTARWTSVVIPLFHCVRAGSVEAVTPVVTLTEIMALPLSTGDTALARFYASVLLNSRWFRTCPISSESAAVAAGMHARYKLRTPDALQIASALTEGCDVFVTNDRNLRRVTELHVVLLSDCV